MTTTSLESPDVAAAWRGWALAAEGVDEPDLALRLWTSAPPEAVPWWEAELGAVRALLVLRRFPEALRRVQALAAQVQRTAGDPLDLMLAAAYAATGDDGAYDHLLAAARAPRLSMPAPALLRVVGAVAEQRGRVRDAAWAWSALVEQLGVMSPDVVAAYAASLVAARTPDETAGTLLARVRSAHDALDRLDPHPADDPAPVIAAATRLTERGDTAGARLLLRAVDVSTPGITALKPVARSITPTRKMAQWGLLAVVAFVALVVLAIVLRNLTGGARASTGLLVTAAAAVWTRTVPLPGFNRPESEVYRVLARGGRASEGRLLGGGGVVATRSSAPGAPRRNVGLWVLGMMLGVVAGVVLAFQVTEPGGLAGPDGLTGDLGPVVWLSVTAAAGAAGFLAFRQADLIVQRRLSLRRAAKRREALHRQAAVCVCRAEAARVRDAATSYTQGHLAPRDGGTRLPSIAPGSAVGLCVATRAVWLAGPIGAGGRPLALNGLAAPR